MKQYGFVGKGTGKLGSSVFAISGGEQIVRQYNPVVSNPNTEAQVNQRAKLKLMSQLAAAMASAIAFKKQGLVSARNQFVKKNIELATIENGAAKVDYRELQITAGSLAIPDLSLLKGSQDAIDIKLAADASINFRGVVYNIFKVEDDNKLAFVKQVIINEPTSAGTFPTSESIGSGDFVVYAYGIKATSSTAAVKYDNYFASFADNEASLDWTTGLNLSDYALSVTTASTLTI